MANPNSLTGQYLSGKRKIAVPAERRKGNGNFLRVIGASENNLKNVDAAIPLGTFTCVTGVSGSGKSSLVNEILFKRLGVDPAVASGPLITTVNDLVAVTAYYGLAWLLLIEVLHF